MAKVTLDEDTIDGAVRGIETGRRVGWAKAFDALRRADSAERDVNVLRADNRILASFAARCYGALEVTAKKRVTELFRGDHHDLVGYFPQGPLNKGRDAMRTLLGKQQDELNALRRRIEELRQGSLPELQAESDRRWVAAKREVRRDLMEQFGIPDDDAFFGWLARYREEHP
jgi:hypothetical protein